RRLIWSLSCAIRSASSSLCATVKMNSGESPSSAVHSFAPVAFTTANGRRRNVSNVFALSATEDEPALGAFFTGVDAAWEMTEEGAETAGCGLPVCRFFVLFSQSTIEAATTTIAMAMRIRISLEVIGFLGLG